MPPPTGREREARVRAPSSPLERVLTMARVLRGPGGCPWDREQTVPSMTPYLQEETFEVVEAVAAKDPGAFREELGDLLFLVVFLGVTAEDEGWGSIDEIAEGLVEKLIRRHPHVFGDGEAIEAEHALRQWEELKRNERAPADRDGEAPTSLGRRPRGLPALTTAYRISEKAGAVGFQWPDVRTALAKVEEEVAEVRDELEGEARDEELERELGDLLYSVVNLARYLRLDPERALRATTGKFMRRFRYVEAKLRERGKVPESSTLQEMDDLWNRAKEEGVS